MSLRGAAAITGIGELPGTKGPVTTTLGMAADVAKAAIEDAGLKKGDVDGVLAAPSLWDSALMWSTAIADYVGLEPSYTDTVDIGGAGGPGMVWRAAAAIRAGLCRHVLCVSADAISVSRYYTKQPSVGPVAGEFERPYVPVPANMGYALIARRHMHEYGTTSRQLAQVAVRQRANGCLNPTALFHDQRITVDDVLQSPIIADPLHRLDCVMPVSGAAAYVVSSADVARDGRHKPVYLLGYGESVTSVAITRVPTTSPLKAAAVNAFRMAGLTPGDMGLACLYDCYTIAVAIFLEDAGFCPKGEGGRFVEEADFSPTGKLPINTHGGQLSCGQAGHAGGMTQVVEAVRQVRGEAGLRQAPRCETAFVSGNGGLLSTETALVLGRSL